MFCSLLLSSVGAGRDAERILRAFVSSIVFSLILPRLHSAVACDSVFLPQLMIALELRALYTLSVIRACLFQAQLSARRFEFGVLKMAKIAMRKSLAAK